MPEGHTVHRVARDMAELQGRPVHASSPQGRFGEEAATVDGTVVEGVDAHGKHLFVHLHGERAVHVHLGMQGKWFRSTAPQASPLKQVRLRLATESVAWDLVAPSRCDLLDPRGVAAVVSRLGPDPLRPGTDEADGVAALRRARGAVGAVVLDQAVVSGVGNVFRSEALHAVGIAPTRPVGSLSDEELRALWQTLQRMMAQAVLDGRIVTVDGPDRLEVPESEARKVYKQTRCRDCGAPVVTGQVGGRTSYHCPVEQR